MLASKVIARKTDSGLAVNSAYQNRFTMVASASETTITLHAVTRLDSGDYRYTIENNNLDSAESEVEIAVRCKYSTYIFFTNANTNQATKKQKGSAVTFSCMTSLLDFFPDVRKFLTCVQPPTSRK